MKVFNCIFFIIIITISIIYSVVEICDIVQNDLAHWRKLIYYGITVPFWLAVGYGLYKYLLRYAWGESIDEDLEETTNTEVVSKKRFYISLGAFFVICILWDLFSDYLKYDVHSIGHYLPKALFYTLLYSIIFYWDYKKEKKKKKKR